MSHKRCSSRIFLRLAVCALALALGPVLDAGARMRAPETGEERAKPTPVEDKAQLAQRSREHHAAGRHAEALTDLERSCRLEKDAQGAELCLAEVADYAKTYNLAR